MRATITVVGLGSGDENQLTNLCMCVQSIIRLSII
jgi:uncharacterized protein YabN with tetrapyrrole methylase and pyrophosphatase domain